MSISSTAVVATLDGVNARDFAEAQAAQYSRQALTHLEAGQGPQGAAGEALQQFGATCCSNATTSPQKNGPSRGKGPFQFFKQPGGNQTGLVAINLGFQLVGLIIFQIEVIIIVVVIDASHMPETRPDRRSSSSSSSSRSSMTKSSPSSSPSSPSGSAGAPARTPPRQRSSLPVRCRRCCRRSAGWLSPSPGRFPASRPQRPGCSARSMRAS